MVYGIVFLVRYFPFWAIPLAVIVFEFGMYHHNRRERGAVVLTFGVAGLLVVVSLVWLVLEGFWRAGPIVKRFFDLLVV